MASQNRGQRITKLLTQVKKQYKPVPPPPQRPLLEHLLFASLLENSPHDVAEKVFDTLKSNYCGWNEVRVSTRRELAEVLKPLNDPTESAERLKKTLHNVFESVYQFDLELLKKQNLGASMKQLEGYVGTTPFMVSYVAQHSLGGHSIPINKGLLIALEVLEVITPAEAAKHTVPGLERTVSKSKGIEVASMLHQLGIEVGKNPYGTNAKKALLALDASCKPRLPKKPAPEPPPKPAKPKKKAAAAKEPATKAKPAKEATAAKSKAASGKTKSKPAAASKPTKKAAPTKKAVAKKAQAKKTPTKKAAAKKKAAVPKKKAVSKGATKKKVAKKTAKPVKKTKTSKKLTKKKPK